MSQRMLRHVATALTAVLGLAGGTDPDPTNQDPCDPDDGVTIDDFIMWDGPGAGTADLPVRSRKACAQDRVITFTTYDITARAGEDYVGVQSGTVVLRAGTTSTTVRIQIIGDVIQEPTEYFGVRLLQGAKFDDADAVVVIRDR